MPMTESFQVDFQSTGWNLEKETEYISNYKPYRFYIGSLSDKHKTL